MTAALTAGMGSADSCQVAQEIVLRLTQRETHLRGARFLGKGKFGHDDCDLLSLVSLCPRDQGHVHGHAMDTARAANTRQHPRGTKIHMTDATCRETFPS